LSHEISSHKNKFLQHFGHFLLTNLLLPKLRQTAWEEKYPSKVITLSSSLNALARRRSKQSGLDKVEFGIDLNDIQCQMKRYALFDQYAQSKLANILFSRELGRREKLRARKSRHPQSSTANNGAHDTNLFCPIQSYSLHPGLVRTNVVRDMPWYLYYPNAIFAFFLAVLQKTPRSGAYTSVFCAVVDDFSLFEEESGLSPYCYYVNSEICDVSDAASVDEVSELVCV
jgi:NAD(P)-dependent dehydrogenase (short-subunit alcohol dehydrogenase family)